MFTRRSMIAGLAGSTFFGAQARAEDKPLVISTSYAG
jgi:hypothetical protein